MKWAAGAAAIVAALSSERTVYYARLRSVVLTDYDQPEGATA
jgi:hypothetical protein